MGQAFTHLRWLVDQSRPPKPKWGVNDIPDLSGKVVIITGGNTGIGYETAKALLPKGAKVYLACRSEDKAMAAIARLKEETGKDALFLQLDLANLKAIKKSAEDFLSKESQLNILFNNGGVMMPPIEQTTADGYDLQFGTNGLGHFYFTKKLLPALVEAAKVDPIFKARIVNTSSSGHMFFTTDFDTFRDGPKRKKQKTSTMYFQSKFVNVIFAKELARRYADQGIVSTSLNPGNLKTELQRHASKFEQRLINLMLFPAPLGALTQLYAGTSPEGADFNGKYLIPWARIGPVRKEAEDPELAKKVWDWMENEVKNLD